MRAVLDIVLLVLQLYIWLLIAAAVLSWLVAFNVVNTRNQVVHMVGDFLYRITEPLLRPIRSMMPNLGGIDVSPVILILLILLLENVIVRYIYPNVFWDGRGAAVVGGSRRRRARRAADAQRRPRRHRRHRDAGRRPQRAQGAGQGGAERRRGQRRTDPPRRQGGRRPTARHYACGGGYCPHQAADRCGLSTDIDRGYGED